MCYNFYEEESRTLFAKKSSCEIMNLMERMGAEFDINLCYANKNEECSEVACNPSILLSSLSVGHHNALAGRMIYRSAHSLMMQLTTIQREKDGLLVPGRIEVEYTKKSKVDKPGWVVWMVIRNASEEEIESWRKRTSFYST